jgi:hypothetical protein
VEIVTYHAGPQASVVTCNAKRGHVGVGHDRDEGIAMRKAVADLIGRYPLCKECQKIALLT